MTDRKEFEEWYVCNAFDYERDPIGSRDCGLQWAAWQAGQERLRGAMERWRAAARHLKVCLVCAEDGIAGCQKGCDLWHAAIAEETI